ncbi:MAG TPA: DNA cytosine methyltransferase [Reyranella sp.]|nr:DNA cytosine methyltransferase [Reyranella sp.]
MTGLLIDLFAGGGGASTGIEAALGRPVDLAINHDAVALAAHRANHPKTRHLTADIWDVKPEVATRGEPVYLLWASPDCTHFSVAKGNVPRKQNIRSLAWVVTRWAKAVRPQIIMLENVSEFKGWGPLGKDGRPDKARMGQTFDRWRKRLENLGYAVDCRVLDASAYGAPTKRRRLFLIARRDGVPILWPAVTHGSASANPDLFAAILKPLHTAAECIDWSLRCPSIFERKRPLAGKTLWRIAEGMRRFVFDNPAPFIVKVNHGNLDDRSESLDAPLSTVTASRRGHAVVVPSIVGVGGRAGQTPATGMAEPVGTVTAKNDRALLTPVMIAIDHAGSKSPATTPADAPLPTTTVENRHALIAPTLIQTGYGERDGQAARALDIEQPLGTVVAGGQKHALCTAFIAKHFGDRGQRPGLSPHEPLATVTASDHHSLVAANLLKLRGDNHGADLNQPLPTVTANGNHLAEVRAFLVTYYGQGVGQTVRKPMRTLTTKDRMGLVTIAGTEYQIVDIGLRMLEPEELLRAQFGRFAAGYDLSAAKTKSGKVRLIGNSVCPEAAEALVRANIPTELAAAA